MREKSRSFHGLDSSVLREDPGLDRPGARQFGRLNQGSKDLLAQPFCLMGGINVDAVFHHARVTAPIRDRARRRPSDDSVVPYCHESKVG